LVKEDNRVVIDISKIKSGEDILSKQPSKQKGALRTKQKQKQKQTTAQLQFQLLQQRVTTRAEKPFIPPVIAFDWDKTLTQAKRKLKEEPDIFQVLGKRFGMYKPIGTFETQKEAEKKAMEFLKTTLGRTAKIYKDEQPLKFGELKSFGMEFRPAKKDTTKIIQKAKYSLGTRSEVSEIMGFKKRASKKKKSNFINWFS